MEKAAATRTRNPELTRRSASSRVTGSWAASAWGEAERPRMAWAGSPGSASVAANTTAETAASTAADIRARRSRKRATPPRARRAGPRGAPGGSARASSPAVPAGTFPGRSGEPDRAEAMAEVTERDRSLAGSEAPDPVAVGADQVEVERDDVPAVVVLDGLHLVDELPAQGRAGR